MEPGMLFADWVMHVVQKASKYTWHWEKANLPDTFLILRYYKISYQVFSITQLAYS